MHNLNKNNRLFLLFENKKIIGFSLGHIKTENYYITHIYFHSKYQHNGDGKKLIIRHMSYLRVRNNMKNLYGVNVFNSNVFDLFKKVVNRKNNCRKYKLLLGVDTHQGFDKIVNNDIVKKKEHLLK